MTWRGLPAAVLLLALWHPSLVLGQPESYAGMSLAEALQRLQARGLNIIFSSAIVTGDLRVSVEPRTSTPRQQLDELLAPHHLTVREGPGNTLQVIRAKKPQPRRGVSRGALEGLVVDAQSAVPLAGAVVRVDGLARGVHSDSAGRFAIREIAEGTRVVVASATGYAPVSHRVAVDNGVAYVTLRLLPEARRHHEFVAVQESAPARTDRGVASEVSVGREDFARLHGSVGEDPLWIMQAFPGTTAVDDLQSDIIVRGSPFRHAALIIDGVPAHWLRHTVFGRGATGSMMMLSGLVVERATLRTGAYPRRHGDSLGSEIELGLRQGSRSAFMLRGVVGGAHAVVAAEGPLGRRGASGIAPGSWLVSARQSYLEWPPPSSGSSRTPFGFSDGVAKLVFDIRPGQQLALTAITGVSSIDVDEEEVGASDLAAGATRASAVSMSWRAALGAGFHVSQQASLVTQRFSNLENSGDKHDGGASQALTYRADFSRAMAGGLLEGGGLVEGIRTRRSAREPHPLVIDGSSWQRSGFAHFSWPAGAALTISPGVRLTWSSLTPAPVVSRWLLAEWSFRRGWSLLGSAGASRQLPDLVSITGRVDPSAIGPERAAHWEGGVEHQTTNDIRWRATVFGRREADVIEAPGRQSRVLGTALAWPAAGDRYANALSGTSYGFELLVTRPNARALSGWAAYTYGRTRQRDPVRDEVFWADFDQRHTFNLFAQYQVSRSTTIGATFRAGSNFPIAGYFTTKDRSLFVGEARNAVRLPPYLRLDVRADHRFRYFGGRFTVFGEVRNALNRVNVGLADGRVDPITGEARGFTERVLRRRISGGLAFDF